MTQQVQASKADCVVIYEAVVNCCMMKEVLFLFFFGGESNPKLGRKTKHYQKEVR